LHELPRANLDHRSSARTGARELAERQIAGLDPGQRFTRLRLFQSQHSYQQGCRLQHLPRPGGPHAADV
jgi:hypothetical protein